MKQQACAKEGRKSRQMKIEHNRKGNCIQFLGIPEGARVLFLRDTPDGIYGDADVMAWQNREKNDRSRIPLPEHQVPEAGLSAGSRSDGRTAAGEKTDLRRNEGSDEGYAYVLYRMDACIRGQISELADKIAAAYESVAKDGRLVLLMDNPYALHMFAGGTDDEGNLFPTLQKHTADATWVSGKLLEMALRKAVPDAMVRWYYPYPTLDFPVAIYSDDFEPPQGDCEENFYHFEHARAQFFSERDAFDEVVKSGMFREFANCYLVVIGPLPEKELLYCRFSNERAKGLKIRTDVIKQGVRKSAYDAVSTPHIERLPAWEEKLNQQFSPLMFQGRSVMANHVVEKEKGSVTFAFVQGGSLEMQLDALLDQGQVDAARQLLLDYCGLLKKQPDLRPFVMTDEFAAIFGRREEKRPDEPGAGQELLAAPVTDIDMICRNVLMGETVTVIDYEWTFDFPIPVDYVIYRILFFYLEFSDRKKRFGDFDFYDALAVTKSRREWFSRMEAGFQKYVQGDVKLLSDAYYEMGMPVLYAGQIQKQLKQLEQSRIHIRLEGADGLKEEERMMKQDAEGVASFVIDFAPGTVTGIELMPDVSEALCRICLLQEDMEGTKELGFTANGCCVAPIVYLFDKPAQIRIKELLPNVHRIYVSIEKVALPDTFVVESKKSLCDLKENLANREQQLEDLYHSTSWKLTRPLRRLKGNE